MHCTFLGSLFAVPPHAQLVSLALKFFGQINSPTITFNATCFGKVARYIPLDFKATASNVRAKPNGGLIGFHLPFFAQKLHGPLQNPLLYTTPAGMKNSHHLS